MRAVATALLRRMVKANAPTERGDYSAAGLITVIPVSRFLLILIVVLALVVRLIGIDQPFVDPWSWRQSDVAAIARNFSENGFHFTRPQIDWAGNERGYVGTEFPVLPFLAALCYRSSGVEEWVGRIQGVLFFVVALPFFFGLVRRIFGELVARWATFFYAFAPLGLVASRAFMPDIPSLSLAIIGLYFFLRWVEEERFGWLATSAILVSLALLIKAPTAIIGAPLFYLALSRAKKRGENGDLEIAAPWREIMRWERWLFAAVTLVPSALWYWHAYRIAERFYPHHFFGAGGFQIMSFAWSWHIVRQTAFSSLTLALFALAIFGAMIGPRGKYARLFHWWFAAMLVFVVVAGYGNRHQWYQLPLVPIASVFAGCAVAWFATRTQTPRLLLRLGAMLLAVSFALSSYYCVQPFYRPAAASLRNLGIELREATTPNSLIIAATEGDPTVFYYAHRKGWHFLGDGIYDGNPVDSAQIIANLEKLRSRGATHLVFYAGTQWWLDYYKEFAEHLAANATLVEQTQEFTIYKLAPASP
jgi:4-amino-4-deoxy-L-arabinose transferase-like glycosyltransferase